MDIILKFRRSGHLLVMQVAPKSVGHQGKFEVDLRKDGAAQTLLAAVGVYREDHPVVIEVEGFDFNLPDQGGRAEVIAAVVEAAAGAVNGRPKRKSAR